jgi:hypothetical protein
MRFRHLGGLALVLAMVWLARADQPTFDEVELNRLQLEKWKKDAPHYARLRRNLAEFLRLPPERQEAMRQLDHALQQEDSATSAHLLRTLDRYADWLNQLPEEDRQSVLNSTSDVERLQHIKQVRDREWLLRQPKSVQDELRHLSSTEQSTRIAQLRKQEAEFRNQWELAIVYWDQGTKMRNQSDKFSDDLRTFIKESLEPMLSAAEKKQLLELKDKWPLFEMKLVELVDKHPIKYPGPTTGIKTPKEWPESLAKAFPGLKNQPTPQMIATEGRWPEYAEVVSTVVKNRSRARKSSEHYEQLGKCRPADFSEPVRNFLKNDLMPVLKESEKAALQKDEGSWPDYPRTLVRLAREHRLTIPGMTLPGTRDLWEPFRRKSATKHDFLPEVPDRTLLDFANHELTAAERASLPSMSLLDPQSREEWKRAYFMRHPEVMKALKSQDVRKERTTKQN